MIKTRKLVPCFKTCTPQIVYINDKHNQANRSTYCRAKQHAQAKLRQMKNRWWQAKADLLQTAADSHNMKAFRDGLKAVYSQRAAGSALSSLQMEPYSLIDQRFFSAGLNTSNPCWIRSPHLTHRHSLKFPNGLLQLTSMMFLLQSNFNDMPCWSWFVHWLSARWTTATRFSLVSPPSCKTGCSPSWMPYPVWFSQRERITHNSIAERITSLLRELHWLIVPERVTFRLSVLAYRCLHGTAPAYLAESLLRTSNVDTRRRLRSADSAMLVVPSTRRSTLGDPAFPVASARAWNSLPSSVRNAPSLTTFRRELKTVLLWSSFDDD